MRVLIDTTYEGRGHTGTGTYLRQLIPALRGEGVDVVTVFDKQRRPPGTGSVRNALGDARWARETLAHAARHLNADVVHHPLPAHTPGVRNVVTVHDLAFELHPELFDRRFATWARIAHASAARKAHAVIAVSQTTANDAMTRWGLPRDRVVVAHHGPGQPVNVRRRKEPRHVLYVGDDEPRKNLAMLDEAIRLYGKLPLRRATPDDDLAQLHAEALALVHPALHEGFGLTVVEALAAGTPVIAYPSLAVREIAGPAALYATSAQEIADHLERVAEASDGRARAARYSWEKCARAHLQAYTLAAP